MSFATSSGWTCKLNCLMMRARRLLDGRMATHKSHAARLQSLDADVLVSGVRAAGFIGRIFQGWARLARDNKKFRTAGSPVRGSFSFSNSPIRYFCQI